MAFVPIGFAMNRYVIENSKAFILVGLLLCPFSALGQGPYVDYATFQQWAQLVPEVRSPEVCGLTDAAHRLWSQKQLRVPETTFIQGDFSGTGRTDWIVQLHQPESKRACDYVLIVTRSKGNWERLFFKEIQPTDRWALLWYSKRRAIAIDMGEHRRRTAPAEMSWSQDKKWSQPGFVVDDALIATWIEWDKKRQRYEYKKSDKAEWWEIEQQ